jgi:hypothetical protein
VSLALLGLAILLPGLLAWLGVWRGWQASPFGRNVLSLLPIGFGLFLTGMGLALGSEAVQWGGVVISGASLLAAPLFFSGRLGPRWASSPSRSIRPLRAEAGPDSPAIPDVSSFRPVGAAAATGRGQQIMVGSALLLGHGRGSRIGFGSMGVLGKLRLFPDRLEFQPRRGIDDKTPWSLELAALSRVWVRPGNLMKALQGSTPTEQMESRSLLAIESQGEQLLFSLFGPEKWASAISQQTNAGRRN